MKIYLTFTVFFCSPSNSNLNYSLFLIDVRAADGHCSRRNIASAGSATGGSSGANRRSNLRTSSGCGSSQRLSGGNRDHSVTQFAVIDDENVSALQQVSEMFKSNFEEEKRTFKML